MWLYHYSPNPNLTLDHLAMSRTTPLKPGGLWLSDDSRNCGWARWCLIEDFMPDRLAYKYAIEIDLANILIINNLEQIEKITKENLVFHIKYRYFDMNWNEIHAQYKGVLFSPYEKYYNELNDLEKYLWWSGIDCDSACVWDHTAIRYFGLPELTGFASRKTKNKLFKRLGRNS